MPTTPDLSGTAAPPVRRLPAGELRQYRLLGSIAVGAIVLLGLLHRTGGAPVSDPLLERGLVVAGIAAAVALSFVYRRPGFRNVVFGVYSLITLWVVRLLYLNDLSPDYAISVFLVVAAVGTTFRSVRPLQLYLAGTAASVGVVTGLVDEPMSGGLSPTVYLAEVIAVCLLLYLILRSRLETEGELARTQSYYRSLIESTDDVVAVLDREGSLTYVSPQVEGLLGRATDELIGESALSLIRPEDRGTVGERCRSGSAGAGADRLEFTVVDTAGRSRHVEASVQDLLHHPAVNGVVVSARDVTSRIALERELRRGQKMEAVGRVAAGLAHDFNNLLGVIQGHAALLAQDAQGQDRESLDEIIHATRAGSDMTRELLEFGHSPPGRTERLDLARRIGNMRSMLDGLGWDEVEYRLIVPDEEVPVEIDPTHLERILVNLVTNAREAIPEGGMVTIEVRAGSDGGSSIEEDHTAGFHQLRVEDTGRGIDPEELENLFEPFFTTKGRGSGLGLTAVYGLVERHHGFVHVDSAPGRGACFIVCLPPAGEAGVDASRTLV